MASNPLTQLMNDFGQEVVEKAMLNLGVYRTVNGKKRRAVASDTLRKSLAFRYDNKYKRIDFFAKGKAADYAYYVEEGRKPGRRPPTDAILQWMKIKKISPRNENGSFKKFATPKAGENAMEAIAYNISMSIGRRGIKPLFYYRDAVNETLVDFNDKFMAALKSEITIAIEENLAGTIKV